MSPMLIPMVRNRAFRCLILGLLLSQSHELQARSTSAASEARIEAVRQQVEKTHLAQCDLSLFLAGDTILTVPWSHDNDPDFLRLIGEIRAADAAIVNLETITSQGARDAVRKPLEAVSIGHYQRPLV